MSHLRCARCSTRAYAPATIASPAMDVCPVCESPLEPVDDLAALVGLPLTGPRRSGAQLQRTDDRVPLIARRRKAMMPAGAQLDLERWDDDGGSVPPAAMTAPRSRAAR